MTRVSPTLILTALSACPLLAGPTVASLGSPITISDQNVFGSGWYGDHEDNETEPRPFTTKGQEWDLEGMYLKNWTLTMVGGFDFKNGADLLGTVYKGGDIFIAVNHNPVFGSPANDASGTGGTTTNSFGYDYVIHFNSDVTKYSVLQIDSATIVNQVTDVPSSNPATYASGGHTILTDQLIAGYGTLTAPVYGALTTYPYSTTGLQGTGGNNNHYYLAVDTSFLPVDSLATFHYTVECGNDALLGQARVPSTVPDGGGTVLLLAGGLGALGLAWRRLRG